MQGQHMIAISKCLIVVALLCGSAASIADQVVDYIYVGTVATATSSQDGIGLFGPAGASLAGDSFTARFRFNLSAGAHLEGTVFGPFNDGVPGDPAGGSPLVSASLTINGRTTPMYGGGWSQVTATPDCCFSLSVQAAPSEPLQGTMAMDTELGGTTAFPLGGLDVPGIWYSANDVDRYYIIYTTGSFGITVNSVTSHGNLVAATLTIADVPVSPLSLACPSATAPEGTPYNSMLSATGGLPPYTFSIGTGLPQGLSLNTQTGAISGTPTTNGAFTFKAQVVDSLGTASDTLSSSCTITVAPAPPAVALLADLLADVQGIGSGNLANEVQLAQTYYAAHDVPATCAVLTALVENVKVHVEKKRDKTHRGDIIRDARAIQHAIGCFDKDGRSCRDSRHHVERARDDQDCHRRERTEGEEGHQE
jgi:hypothetical protein